MALKLRVLQCKAALRGQGEEGTVSRDIAESIGKCLEACVGDEGWGREVRFWTALNYKKSISIKDCLLKTYLEMVDC